MDLSELEVKAFYRPMFFLKEFTLLEALSIIYSVSVLYLKGKTPDRYDSSSSFRHGPVYPVKIINKVAQAQREDGTNAALYLFILSNYFNNSISSRAVGISRLMCAGENCIESPESYK